jgi:hypothetical protein
MQMTVQAHAAPSGRPLYRAREKTGRIQRDLAVAGAELELTNIVLDERLPESVKRSSDVQRALTQNGVIEEKVQEAADELQVVTELLEEETAERERLERELARRPAS